MVRALARVDVGAIERNCARLAATVAPARLCAVVKADGYGHGGVAAARAALRGGAASLAVAIAARADVVAWRERFVAALPPDQRVHVKLDTGMGRLGTRDPDEASRVVAAAG